MNISINAVFRKDRLNTLEGGGNQITTVLRYWKGNFGRMMRIVMSKTAAFQVTATLSATDSVHESPAVRIAAIDVYPSLEV